MAELLLDPDIRFWVFLPIVVITFFTGIIRHYVTILLTSEKKTELQQVTDRYFFYASMVAQKKIDFIKFFKCLYTPRISGANSGWVYPTSPLPKQMFQI